MGTESREETRRQATLAVWGGEETYLMDTVTQVPVVHSVSFGYDDLDEWRDVALGEREGHIYGRNTNPTVAVFEEKVRLLEDAEAATSFATGMAAISDTMDIERLATAAKRVGATVVVDNMFATPINQNPLELGADLMLHSATKYLGGHADALGRVVCGPAELDETRAEWRG
jgi:cystathionine beta-lyase/cystathionine gamma-synthase